MRFSPTPPAFELKRNITGRDVNHKEILYTKQLTSMRLGALVEIIHIFLPFVRWCLSKCIKAMNCL